MKKHEIQAKSFLRGSNFRHLKHKPVILSLTHFYKWYKMTEVQKVKKKGDKKYLDKMQMVC